MIEFTQTKLVHLSDVPCDLFEAKLLPVARYQFASLNLADPTLWHKATATALIHWPEAIGYPIAHGLGRLVIALYCVRQGKVMSRLPWEDDSRNVVTEDEAQLLGMLHHMRRDNDHDARQAVDDVTLGVMDPDVIRAGLSFATRFAHGAETQGKRSSKPLLTLVS